MNTAPDLDEPIDGRTARAVRTRDAIVDACLGLIDEGDMRPTGPRIAERAGVSVRSVFQHFDDLETLFAAVGSRVAVRMTSAVTAIDPADPVAARVDAFVAQRSKVLEGLTPVMRAAFVYAASSAVIMRQFSDGQEMFRRQVRDVFAGELAAAPEPDRLSDALVVASSWPTWDNWRTREERSFADASASMRWTVQAALAAAGFPG
jgi:AcrR family transcriptional regulator